MSPAALRPDLRALCPNSPRSVIASPCPKQRASSARTAPQSTCLFAPRRDRHQTTRLNVAGVARRFRAAKASSFLSILIGSRTDPSQGGARRVRAASVGGLVIHAMPRRRFPPPWRPTPRWIGGASSSATPTGRRSPGYLCEEEPGLRPPRTACAVTLPSCAASYSLSWPGQLTHAYQSAPTSVFPLPKLQSALPSRQSRSRAREGRSRSRMQCLQGTTRCPRRAVRPEILSVAESDSR